MKWGISVCCAIRFHCLIDKDEGNNGVDQPFKLGSILWGLKVIHLNWLYISNAIPYKALCRTIELNNFSKS